MKSVNLREWCMHYIKARDAMERKLKSIEEKDGNLIAHYKDKDVLFVGQEKLTTTHASHDGFATLVCLQTQENFDTLVDSFSKFSANQKLTIIFVNPQLEEKWIIKPAVHAAVADKSSLKAGLLTLYQMVPPL